MVRKNLQNKTSWLALNWLKAATLMIIFIAGYVDIRVAIKELQVQMRLVLSQIRINGLAQEKEKDGEIFTPVFNSFRDHRDD